METVGRHFRCAAIARDKIGTWWLVGLVAVLGLLFGLPAIPVAPERAYTLERTATVGMFEATGNAKQPTWIALLNPLLGSVGIMIGAPLTKSRRSVDMGQLSAIRSS